MCFMELLVKIFILHRFLLSVGGGELLGLLQQVTVSHVLSKMFFNGL